MILTTIYLLAERRMKTSIKTCKECGQSQPIDEFYGHSQMADGHLNKCKRCVKSRVRRHRSANVERIREYDRERAKSGTRKKRLAERSRKFRKENPDKYRAHSAVSNALRSGTLVRPSCCERCSETQPALHGHHEDYSRPLDVVWLCVPCHSARHKEIDSQWNAPKRKQSGRQSLET